MYCNKCGQETNNPRLCDTCNEISSAKTKKLSDIDINSLSEKLVNLGIVVCVISVLWWASTYSFAKDNILNFARCLYSNDTICSISAVILNGTSGTIAYNSIFLWIGVISLIIGKLIQPKANTSKNIQTFISSIHFDQTRNKIIDYNYKKQINKILSFLNKNKIKTSIVITMLIVIGYTLNYYYEYYAAKSKINNEIAHLVCKLPAYQVRTQFKKMIKSPELSYAMKAGINDEVKDLLENCPKKAPSSFNQKNKSYDGNGCPVYTDDYGKVLQKPLGLKIMEGC